MSCSRALAMCFVLSAISWQLILLWDLNYQSVGCQLFRDYLNEFLSDEVIFSTQVCKVRNLFSDIDSDLKNISDLGAEFSFFKKTRLQQ